MLDGFCYRIELCEVLQLLLVKAENGLRSIRALVMGKIKITEKEERGKDGHSGANKC